MSRKKSNKTPIIILLVLLILAAALLGGIVWFVGTHFFVGGRAYAKDARVLELRDQDLTVEDYNSIRQQLPEAEIFWSVPFQNGTYPDDTTELSVQSLSEGDLAALPYFGNLKKVDATGCRDYSVIQALQEQYPDVEVIYTVSIGGQEYPKDARKVATDTLSDEEIALMAYLPDLQEVDASACRNYEQIGKLMQQHPEMKVSYQVELLGKTFTEADTAAAFDDPDVNVLLESLAWLPHMETVDLGETSAEAADLRKLVETYPNVSFGWEKTVLGKTFSNTQTEFDLAGTVIDNVTYSEWAKPVDEAATTDVVRMVEEAMAYFPNAEKVILPAHYYHNETMSAFREKMRPEYKVVWYVHITKHPVRTDQEVIHSSAMGVCLIDEQSYDLKYCEDAVVVDIGHSYVKYIEWVRYMPKLKYLILAHNWVKDLTPISTCKNLVYLELFWNGHIPDYTPLLGCTSLQDLNISGAPTNPEPLAQMTWLKNLWANMCPFDAATEEMLRSSLPDTHIEFDGGTYTSKGWRELQSYYDMRDFMGLPYNRW